VTTGKKEMRQQRGVGLIELMVAMLIGLFLIIGAVTVFNQSRNTYRASEGVARLQETARLAMDVIESDIRMANYWGMNNRADYVINRAGPSQPTPGEFTTAQQRTNVSLCGTAASNWVINLDEYIGGSNNSYGLQCAASNYQAGSDVVVIRRANEARPLALDPNRVYLQTSRIQGTLFVPNAACTLPTDPTCIPAAYLPPASESRELEARAYYVSSQSTLRNDVPSLRRKRFASVNAALPGNAILDEEIVTGVEDIQIRLGVDTNGDSNIDQYVNPGGVPGNAAVVSVTVWLRVRAEDRDFGHRDQTAYQYADMGAAFTPNDNYRRILVSKTIHIRNSRI
jgi:type IV pilus assembly protein PilW